LQAVRRLVYSLSVSLDGYMESPGHGLDWAIIDEELHRYFNDEAREQSAFLYGRRMYELMAGYWPTADKDPSIPAYMAQWAVIWRDKPKVVFSRTLDTVEWNSRLVRGDLGDEIARLKAEPGGDLSIGGASLAAEAIPRGLVDEYRLLVHPVILGVGTRFFPSLDARIGLRLASTRTFGSGVVLLHYQAS
jgi:dihydrofolate reductase